MELTIEAKLITMVFWTAIWANVSAKLAMHLGLGYVGACVISSITAFGCMFMFYLVEEVSRG